MIEGQEEKSFLVIGLGRFGSNVAQVLYENGHDVLAIDKDMNAVQSLIDSKSIANAMQVDAIDSNTLKRLEVDKFEACVVCVGTSIEDSVLTVANLKELSANKIIAKASSALHGTILEKIGVDSIVYPEAEMGRRVAKQLIGLSFLEEYALNENFSIAEVPLPMQYESQSLAQTDIRSMHQLNILAIRRAGGQFNISPSPKTNLQKNDHLLVLGTHESIEEFRNLEA